MENNHLEQMVIGSLLNNNDLFELVSDVLEWNFFANQVHQIFFKEITSKLKLCCNTLVSNLLIHWGLGIGTSTVTETPPL